MQDLIRSLRGMANGSGRKLLALIAFQLLCTLIFIFDVLDESRNAQGRISLTPIALPEVLATLGLCIGMVVEWRLLLQMQRRQEEMARGLSVAAGAIDALMRRYFAEWGLTPAECDVAAFLIKGCSISEIAALRGSAEGTVKAQLNAIYRKADVTGRAQLVSLLVEDLFAAPLPEITPQAPAQNAAKAV